MFYGPDLTNLTPSFTGTNSNVPTGFIVPVSNAPTNLSIGAILGGGISSNTPYGYLRKITSVITQGDSIAIQTEQASLTEVFENLDLTVEHRIKTNEQASSKNYAEGHPWVRQKE